jgi:hypothetical protein
VTGTQNGHSRHSAFAESCHRKDNGNFQLFVISTVTQLVTDNGSAGKHSLVLTLNINLNSRC